MKRWPIIVSLLLTCCPAWAQPSGGGMFPQVISPATSVQCGRFTSGSTTVVGIFEAIPGASGQRIYICGWVATSNDNQPTSFQLFAATADGTCLNNRRNITPPLNMPGVDTLVNHVLFSGEYTDVGDSLCIDVQGSGTINSAMQLYYQQQ
jgi:hypothetical protein